MSTLRLLTVLVLLLVTRVEARQEFMWEPPGASDFPVADSMVRSYQLMAARALAADQAWRKEPDRARTFDLLLKSGRTDEALDVLDRLVQSRPSDVRPAFASVGVRAREIGADKAHNHAARLRAALSVAKRQLSSLPREEAAGAARALLVVEGELDIQTWNWRRDTEQFVAAYDGTREALLAQVDLLTDRIGPSMLDALDAFISAHAGSEVAAKALYQKGFHLGHNAFSFGWKPGTDPTDRFFKVLEIYRELRSGRYPACEWVEKAPTLVLGFSAYKATYASSTNIDRVLGGYEELLPGLLATYERDPAQDSIKSLVGYRMAELFKMKGDAVAGMDSVFTRLESLAKDPSTVKMLRAELYLRPNDLVLDPQDRDALRLKVVPLLEQVMSSGSGLTRRRAHATLATLHFSENRLEQARALYQQFETAFPKSEYAWVAAMRGAECDEASDPARAAARFRLAATRFEANAVARILGHAYAARAWESAGDFNQALVEYRDALAAWQGYHNARLSLHSRRQPIPGEPFMTRDTGEITRDRLSQRITTLARTLRIPGGTLLERARLAIAQQQWDAAAAASSELLSKHPATPLAGEGRYLGSRARLEKALDVADAERPDASIAEAIQQLEAITREPMNAAVAAAKLTLGTIGHLATVRQDGEALVKEALVDWQSIDRGQSLSSQDPVAREVALIRNVVFQPHGGGVFADGKGWNGFKWPLVTAPFFLVNPVIRVKTSTGEVTQVTSYERPFSDERVVFLDDERRAMLERIMLKLGGTKKRPWVRVMDTPNQPAGASLHVLALWKNVFWAQPGHWGGWVFESYPIINEIEFVDAARTRAAVKVTVGYSGATVQMEKKDGVWRATALTNFWVT